MSNFRSFDRVVCYKIVTLEGSGTEEDVYREVEWWYDEDGKLLRMEDPKNWTYNKNSIYGGKAVGGACEIEREG